MIDIRKVDDETLDLLFRLMEVDGTNGSVFIYDQELVKTLNSEGLIKRNQIGWCWGTSKLADLLKQFSHEYN